MICMDAEGEAWYSSAGEDLYLKDFIFQARMQTARRAAQRWECFPRRDRVLDRLIEEGTFDRQSPDTPDTREELAMSHSVAMVQRLLMRIEFLEADVSTCMGLGVLRANSGPLLTDESCQRRVSALSRASP